MKATEREIASWISEEFNKIIIGGGYPFEAASVESSAEGLFPDITLWISREKNDAFAFFELKPPGKLEDISKLPDKAGRGRVKYYIVWNFNDGCLYEIESGETQRLKPYPAFLLGSLEDCKRGDVQAKIKKALKTFLDDLKELREKGHLQSFLPDKLFFIKMFREAIDALSPTFARHFKKYSVDKKFRDEIEAWAVKQGIANVGDEHFYNTISRQWTYSVVTEILFYHTLRRHFKNLPDITEGLSESQTIGEKLTAAFKEAQKIDWQAVFNPGLFERLGIPEESYDNLQRIIDNLKIYNFSSLKEDVIGEIFEELIPNEERHTLGQYFTREDLVDFIIGFTAKDKDGAYMDPTCGSGTFLNRLYSRIRSLSAYQIKHSDILSKLWGVDISNFPAGLATVNLFRQSVSDYSNFPRILVKDFFEIEPGMICEFPPPRASHDNYSKIKEAIPQFNGIVGNFPYIRQEIIEKSVKGYKNFLTGALAKGWLFDFPEVFDSIYSTKNNGLNHTVANGKAWIENRKDEIIDREAAGGNINLKLSGQADIYAYLFFHAARFLDNKGRLGIVTSNSWMDVSYGYYLKKFFLSKFKIIAIVNSWVEPWFEGAAINTVFTILEKCDDEEARNNHEVKFVKLKKKLEELIPYRDLQIQEQERWARIDNLVRRIEHAGPELARQSKTAKFKQLNDMESFEDDDFRIRLVKQEKLLSEIEQNKEFAKWGRYLRAPDVYFEIIEKLKDKLVPLKELADIRRGYTTGINAFFYLEPIGEGAKKGTLKVKNGRGWDFDIEEEFLKPVIKSPKESKSIIIDPEKLKYRIFICGMSKSELKKAHKMGALRYIEWGEIAEIAGNVIFPDITSVKGRKQWYSIELRDPGQILMQMINNDRFLIFSNEPQVLADHNLFEMSIDKNQQLLCALCNSILFALSRELSSRVNLGDGATKTEGVDWKENVLVPNMKSISKPYAKKILAAYEKLKARPIESIFKEVKKKDRREFDTAVLEAVGLDPKEYLPRIYSGICELVQERLHIPQLRKAQKKEKIARSFDQVKDHIEKELLYGGPREFPESFVSDKDMEKFYDVCVGINKLIIGGQFFGMYKIMDSENDEIYEAKSYEDAKFIVYSRKPNRVMIKVPENEIVVRKALRDYEFYIRELKQKLVTRAYEATFNHRASEKIANDILSDYNLPLI